MKKLLDFIMFILFGKDSLNGYCKPSETTKKKTFTFSSVFPNEEALEEFLNEKA